MTEDKSTKPTKTTAKDTEKVNKEGRSIKLNNKPVLIAGIIAVVLIIAMVIVGIVMGTSKDDGEAKPNTDGNTQIDSDDKADKDNEEKVEPKTLKVGDLSMKYPGKGWKAEAGNNDEAAAISKDREYVMLVTVESDAGMNAKEFAENSLESYTEEGFKIEERPKAVKINGTEWQQAKFSGDGWATVLFGVDGDNYYIATFAGENDGESNDVKDMIQSLTIK